MASHLTVRQEQKDRVLVTQDRKEERVEKASEQSTIFQHNGESHIDRDNIWDVDMDAETDTEYYLSETDSSRLCSDDGNNNSDEETYYFEDDSGDLQDRLLHGDGFSPRTDTGLENSNSSQQPNREPNLGSTYHTAAYQPLMRCECENGCGESGCTKSAFYWMRNSARKPDEQQ